MDPGAVNVVSVSTQLPPHVLKALVENSSKPLLVQGQLSSWLEARSWSAMDISQDLASNPPTSFKVCPRRGTSLYQSFTDGGKRAVYETDCLHIEATYAHFKEWLALNSDRSTSEGKVTSKGYLSCADIECVKQDETEVPPLVCSTVERTKNPGFSSLDIKCADALPLTPPIGEGTNPIIPEQALVEGLATTTKSSRVMLDDDTEPEEHAVILHGAPARKRARLVKTLEETCREDGATFNPLLRFPGNKYWVYADYKYMCNMCTDVPEILDAVDWGVFGFEGRGGHDSVLWVGSEEACTPCHYDSYGYNLVAQLSGQKRWTLFSPEDSGMLYPTRVPFEELSIFSEVDVKSPDLGKYPQFQGASPYSVSPRGYPYSRPLGMGGKWSTFFYPCVLLRSHLEHMSATKDRRALLSPPDLGPGTCTTL